MSTSKAKPSRRGRKTAPEAGNPGSGKRLPQGTPPVSRNTWLALGAILLVTVLAYLPSLGNGFTNWDDDLYVTANPLLRTGGLDAVRTIFTRPVAFNYHPLTVLSLRLDYLLSGLHPGSYHLTNLLLHLIDTVLVFLFIRLLTRGKDEIAFWVALFFAIHPMHVESVAWISERKDVLYAAFFFPALIFYVRFARGEARGLRGWGLSLVFFLLALLSKPAAVVLPFLLLAVDYDLGRPFRRGVLVEKMPFFALAAVFGLITLRVQSAFVGVTQAGDLTFPHKILVACYGIAVYLAKAVVPYGLSALHPYPDFSRGIPVAMWVAAAVVLVLAVLVAWSRRYTRVVVFGALFFLISLILVLQILSIGLATYSERYTYVPYVGIFFAAAAGFDALLRRSASRPAIARSLRALVGAWALVFAALTFFRVQVWKDSGTLWSDVIAKYPDYGGAYVSRGIYFMAEAKDDDAARRDLDRAVALAPHNYLGFYNRGLLRERGGDVAGAVEDYTRAIEANASKPDPYNNRGGLLVRRGDYEGAVADYDRVVAMEPGNPGAYFNRAAALYKAGRFEEAAADYRRGLGLEPANAEAEFFRGVCEFRLNRFEAAAAAFTKALALRPTDGNAFLYRARTLAALGRNQEALNDAEKARSLGATVDPSFLQSLR